MLVAWSSLESLAARCSTALLAASLLVVVGCASAALVLSGVLVLGEIGGGLAAALGTVWLLSLRLADRRLAPGGTPVLVSTLAALLIEGRVFAELPLAAGVLLAAAPLLAWVGLIGSAGRLAPWQRAVLAAFATAVPAGTAVGLALAAAPQYE
jgi:hypothetical protein